MIAAIDYRTILAPTLPGQRGREKINKPKIAMENTIENALNHIADSGIGGEIKHESTGVYRLSFDTEKLAASFVAYADQSCSAKDAEIAELKRRVEELEQNAPKLVLPSVEEMRKYLNGYFGFGGDPSISDREYGFEHGYDYTIDEIKRLNGI